MIKGYLRYRRALLCAAAAACCVFSSVILLGGMPPELVWYAVGVYLFAIGAFCCFDLPRYRRKLRRLDTIRDNLSYTRHEYPPGENNIEQRYSEIIAALYRMMEGQRSDFASASAEQVDYYTMWLHQIKTPIAAMRLAIENADSPDPVYAEELFKIERYVEMALQYTRINSLSADLVAERCAVDEVVSGALRKYATLFIGKGIGVDFAHTGLVVTSDAKWLSFVVEQLLSNAVKYTNRGGVRIYARERALVIEDSGIGIRPEDLALVFERSYTGRNGRIDGRASGLGLYMAARVAKKLGITLSLESKLGMGTKAAVSFPADQCGDADVTKM